MLLHDFRLFPETCARAPSGIRVLWQQKAVSHRRYVKCRRLSQHSQSLQPELLLSRGNCFQAGKRVFLQNFTPQPENALPCRRHRQLYLLSFTHPVNYFEVQPLAKARIVDLRLSIPETPETTRTESAIHPVPVQSREHPVGKYRRTFLAPTCSPVTSPPRSCVFTTIARPAFTRKIQPVEPGRAPRCSGLIGLTVVYLNSPDAAYVVPNFAQRQVVPDNDPMKFHASDLPQDLHHFRSTAVSYFAAKRYGSFRFREAAALVTSAKRMNVTSTALPKKTLTGEPEQTRCTHPRCACPPAKCPYR